MIRKSQNLTNTTYNIGSRRRITIFLSVISQTYFNKVVVLAFWGRILFDHLFM